MRIGGRDIERLYASPETGTAVQHQVERAVRYGQMAWHVLVWKSCPLGSAPSPGRTRQHVMTRDRIARTEEEPHLCTRVLLKTALAH